MNVGLNCLNHRPGVPQKCICGAIQPHTPVLCDETSFCYKNGVIGECVASCPDFPRVANSSCNCNSNTTCHTNDACIINGTNANCVSYPECLDMTINHKDHCVCVDIMTACKEKEYCHKRDSQCLPVPPSCPPIPDVAPEIGCSCSNITVCVKGKMCANESATCIDRPNACEEMPALADAEKCYCEKAHDICEEGYMCNSYNDTCTLPPPVCGPMPDIATEERCVCMEKEICQDGEMCQDDGKCIKRPDDCPGIPDLSPRGGCYCSVSHSLCVQDEMCDNRTGIAKCTQRPPECPPMPTVTYGITGCYCRFSDSICEEMHMCNERNDSCSIPAKCKDPIQMSDWGHYNLEINSTYDESTLFEGTNITFKCQNNTFLTEVNFYF